MNIAEWTPYFPSFVSIYLVFISKVFSGYLRSLVQQNLQVSNYTPVDIEYIQVVALDWSGRLSVLTSFLTAIISMLIIYANSNNGFTAILFVLVLLILFPLMIRIMSLGPGEMISTQWAITKSTPSTTSKVVLVIINIFLMIGIFVSQLGGSQTP